MRKPSSPADEAPPVPGLRRAVFARRPTIAAALSLLLVLKALFALSTVAFPVGPDEPTGMVAGIGCLALLVACGVWVFGQRLPRVAFEVGAAGGSMITSWAIAHASTTGGMMIAAFVYPWTAIYAAHFFSRRGAIVQASIITIGFGVALLVGSLHNVTIYWILVTATIWSICIVQGRFSQALRRQADTDPLTGLLNRAGFAVAANREQAIATRTGAPLTLAVLDLDDFKQVNDRLGHLVGDQLLADLGRAWRERVRTGDILARYGGDEFMLLLPATPLQTAWSVIGRLEVDSVPVSWSVGVAEWLADETLDDCIARADALLYRAKGTARIERAAPAHRPLPASG